MKQVLREGNDDDSRRFIRVEDLVDSWDELILPRHLRQAWAYWIERYEPRPQSHDRDLDSNR